MHYNIIESILDNYNFHKKLSSELQSNNQYFSDYYPDSFQIKDRSTESFDIAFDYFMTNVPYIYKITNETNDLKCKVEILHNINIMKLGSFRYNINDNVCEILSGSSLDDSNYSCALSKFNDNIIESNRPLNYEDYSAINQFCGMNKIPRNSINIDGYEFKIESIQNWSKLVLNRSTFNFERVD